MKEENNNSVPSNVMISMTGFEQNEYSERLMNNLVDIILCCGGRMDLRLLEGITVDTDYLGAINSIELGYDSNSAKGVTNNEKFIGVAKTIRVKRNGDIKVNVIFNANYLNPLVDPTHSLFTSTMNIVAHELGHVACAGWFEQHSPGKFFESYSPDWATRLLRDSAHTIWEEYVACRLSAPLSDEIVKSSIVELVCSAIPGAFDSAKHSVISYRSHRDINKLFIDVSAALLNPLKYYAYLLGHLDGLEDNTDIGVLNRLLFTSEFSAFIPEFLASLRSAWENRMNWDGMEGVDGIIDALLPVYEAVGLDIQLNEKQPGTWIGIIH